MSKRYPSGLIKAVNPDTLVNSALGATAPGVWTLDDVAYYTRNRTWPTYDPYIGNVSLLLHGNGTNGANNNTFLDSSTNNFTVTRNGNVGQGSATPFSTKAYSSFFVAATDYVTATANAGFNFGTGNFTIEFYGCRTATGVQHFPLTNRPTLAGTFAGCWWVDNNTTNIIRVVFYATDGTIYTMNCNCNWPDPNDWFHFAMVRTPTAITAYLNGTQVGTIAVLAAKAFGTSTNAIYAGRFTNSAAWFWPGCLSGIRVVKGTAVYTTAFTPSALPLTAIPGTSLIMCQANRYVDLSANNITVTATGSPAIQNYSPFSPPDSIYDPAIVGGSGYFDGTGDYLNNTTSGVTDFGTGDFTVSYWVYPTVTPSAGFAVHVGTATTSTGLAFGTATANFSATTSATGFTSPIAATINTWHHVTWTRTGTTLRFYRNAVLGYTTTVATNFTELGVGIGAQKTAANPFQGGYISNVRVVKGTAIVPTSVPTAPSVEVAGTSLLVDFTNAGIVDNIMGNTGETFGTAAISTAQSKFGGGSIALLQPSPSNYVSFPHRAYQDMILGDFTIEFWLYPTNFTIAQGFIINKDGVSGSFLAQYEVRMNGTGRIVFQVGAANGLVTAQALTSTSSVTQAAWNHVACVRKGTLLMIFINGVQVGVVVQTITMISGSRALLINSYTNAGSGINGFLNELRITRGVARYTGNFSVPTARFQDE